MLESNINNNFIYFIFIFNSHLIFNFFLQFGYVIVVITLVLIGVSLLVVKLINGDKISWGDAILFAATIGVAGILIYILSFICFICY